MIKAGSSKVEIDGNAMGLITDLIFIIKTFIHHGLIDSEQEILQIYKIAKMSPEELEKSAMEKLDSMDIGDALALMIASERYAHE